MNATELKTEIARRRAALEPTLREIEALERQHDDAASREWLAANKVTEVQVQHSEGPDVPYHGDVYGFGKWLKASGCTKPWAEWNGRLYPVAELIEGHMRREAPGMEEHVDA